MPATSQDQYDTMNALKHGWHPPASSSLSHLSAAKAAEFTEGVDRSSLPEKKKPGIDYHATRKKLKKKT